MYLFDANSAVFNRKWDLDRTRFQIQAAMRAAPSVAVAPAPAPIPYFIPALKPSAAPAVAPPKKPSCRACACSRSRAGLAGLGCNCGGQCSARGVQSVAPQKYLGALNDGGAGVPAGTVLAYSASWEFGLGKGTFGSVADLIAQISGVLANKWGVIIDQSSYTDPLISFGAGRKSITLQVHTNSDYGAAGDIQKIIDGEVYNILGALPASTIRIVKSVSPAAGSPTAQLPADQAAQLAAAQAGLADAQSRGDSTSAAQFAAQIQNLTGSNPLGSSAGFLQWAANNWPILAGAGLAVVAAKELL